jgi:hypothetical protein
MRVSTPAGKLRHADQSTAEQHMPRYIVQRTFPNRLEIPIDNGGGEICRTVVYRNSELGVTWIHSYVSGDEKTTFCVYDAPTPEAIEATAMANDLPVDRITEVTVLDPYFYGHR